MIIFARRSFSWEMREMSVGLKYLHAGVAWRALMLAAASGCSPEGGAPMTRDGSLDDAHLTFETLDGGEPQNDLVDSLSNWNDQIDEENPLDSGVEDTPRMDRMDIQAYTDAVQLDRVDVITNGRDVFRGDAGVFMMGAVRQVVAGDHLTSPFKVCWMSGGLECGERRVTLAAGVDGSDDGSAT